jgi:plasmid maintenance system killer protein
VIRSFRDAEAAKLFHDEPCKRFQAIERTARRKLYQLHQARSLSDLSALPGSDGDAHRVEIVGYH